MTTSEHGRKSRYRLVQRPYLWLTVMAAYALFISALFMVLQNTDQYNPIYYFNGPTQEFVDEAPEYHSGPGIGALAGLVIIFIISGSIFLATVISIPSGIIIILGKHRAAVPAVIALAFWAVVWLAYVSFSNSVIPLLGLAGTIVVIVLGIKGMKKIGDMS